jgi:hypothetical protein
MGAQDKATRGKVLPMRLPVWGFNSNENSDTDITQNILPGDLVNLIGISASAASIEQIRFARPYQGQIERAYLTFDLSYPATGGGDQTQGIYIGRGVFNDGTTGDLSDRATALSAAQIMADHKMAFGRAAPFYPFYSNKEYFVNRVDITKLIANRGEAALTNQYRDYAFIIAIYFPGGALQRPPGGVDGAGWPYHLWDLRVEASALLQV